MTKDNFETSIQNENTENSTENAISYSIEDKDKDIKDSNLDEQKIETKIETIETKDISTIKDEFASKIAEIKAYYENVIAEISVEKNSIEEQYKTSLIKQHLQSLNLNAELLYTIIKGHGDLEYIKYKNGTIQGLDEIISSYKKDENIASLFATKTKGSNDNTNDVYNKIFKTKALNTNSNASKFEKEKNRICSDWCSKN